MDFSNWMDINSQNTQISVAGGERRDVPEGDYLCTLDVMDIRPNKFDGGPRLYAQFRIQQGDFQGLCLFYSRDLARRDGKDGTRIGMGISFLRSLDIIDPEHIRFENFQQFDGVVNEMANIADKKEFGFVVRQKMRNVNGKVYRDIFIEKSLPDLNGRLQGGQQQQFQPAQAPAPQPQFNQFGVPQGGFGQPQQFQPTQFRPVDANGMNNGYPN